MNIKKFLTDSFNIEDEYTERKFDVFKKRFVNRIKSDINHTVFTYTVKEYLSNLLEIVNELKLTNNKLISEAIEQYENDYKKAKIKNLALLNKQTGGRNKKGKDKLEKRKKEIETDYKSADRIIKLVKKFVNSETKAFGNKALKDLQKENEKNKWSNLKQKAGFGLLSAITGSAIPATIPSGLERLKEFKKEWKKSNKTTKRNTAIGLGLSVAGGLFGSPAMMMYGSELRQKANANVQKTKDENDLKSRLRSIQKNSFGNGKPTLLANGGSMVTKGPTNIGNGIVAGEAGQERITVSPLKNDPIVTELKKINKSLDDIKNTNQEMLEDQDEANRREDLKGKKSTLKDTIFKKLGINNKNADGTDMEFGNLIGKLLPNLLKGPMGVVLAGAALLAVSKATSSALQNAQGTSYNIPEGDKENNKAVMGNGKGKQISDPFKRDLMIAGIRKQGKELGKSDEEIDRIIKNVDKESSYDPNAKNPNSTATGLYQFTKGTWDGLIKKYGKKYGYDSNTSPTDPTANIRMAFEYQNESAKDMNDKGIPNTKANERLYQFLGIGDAPKVIKASDDTPLTSLVKGDSIKANPSIFSKYKTAGDLKRWAINETGDTTQSAIPYKKSPTKKSVNNTKREAQNPTESSTLKAKETYDDSKKVFTKEKEKGGDTLMLSSHSTPPIIKNIKTGDTESSPARVARN